MKISKTAVSVALASLFAANVAFAMPGFTQDAPQSSVDTCLAEVSANANYENGTTVHHRTAAIPLKEVSQDIDGCAVQVDARARDACSVHSCKGVVVDGACCSAHVNGRSRDRR